MAGNRNRFGLSEWSGALGDLGTLLPLAYALVLYTGFPPERLFFLWGLTYLVTGVVFKIPLSVQPLKAMTVIAISTGLSPVLLSSTAVYYGLLLLVLVATGMIDALQRWFSPALIRGVQLGIGLLLLIKALDLVLRGELFLGTPAPDLWWPVVALAVLVWGLGNLPPAWLTPGLLLAVAVAAGFRWIAGSPGDVWADGALVQLRLPGMTWFPSALVLLMVPQLPLTLGNAVYATRDACREFWPERSRTLTSGRLATSIGLSNVLIGLLGGFPVCHGSGGVAAHARFGARTGGATVILGTALIFTAIFGVGGQLLGLIPVPLLGAMLWLSGWALIRLVLQLRRPEEVAVAITVGLVSVCTRNLTLAVGTGWAVGKGLSLPVCKTRLDRVAPRLTGKLWESS